jgi:hypothetical protein
MMHGNLGFVQQQDIGKHASKNKAVKNISKRIGKSFVIVRFDYY